MDLQHATHRPRHRPTPAALRLFTLAAALLYGAVEFCALQRERWLDPRR